MKHIQMDQLIPPLTGHEIIGMTGKSVLDLMIEAAYLLGCAGKYRDAETCFRSVLAIQPERVGAALGLGNVLLMQGRVKESEEAYEQVLEWDPSDPAARAFLGELYLCSGRMNEGREILESVYWDYPETEAGTWAWNLLQLSREIAS
ncbi:tetratricopeptide repeat protein [bacterium]|nr:tetratricopeptide repeat protein [candidate division CSSED10-310 bacterium]